MAMEVKAKGTRKPKATRKEILLANFALKAEVVVLKRIRAAEDKARIAYAKNNPALSIRKGPAPPPETMRGGKILALVRMRGWLLLPSMGLACWGNYDTQYQPEDILLWADMSDAPKGPANTFRILDRSYIPG